MKILMFGWEFPPHISGGLGTACYGLTKKLSEIKDTEIILVLPKTYGDEEKGIADIISAESINIGKRSGNYQYTSVFLTEEELRCLSSVYTRPEEYTRVMQKSMRTSMPGIKNPDSESLLFSGKYGNTLFEEIEGFSEVGRVLGSELDFDVIHAHDWLTYPAAIAASHASGKPFVAHIHATEFDRGGDNINTRIGKIENAGFHAADRIISVSDYTRSVVSRNYGIDERKIITIHNAVDFAFNKTADNKTGGKVVTYLGRITRQKGPEYFINAAHAVLQKTDNVRFVMGGSGDLYTDMLHRVAQLGISNKFHFTGFLNHADTCRLFTMSDLYVMPSVSEPFGITPLEALSAGVPVVISRQSGVSEVLKYAIKTDFWDVHALADAIYGNLFYPALSEMLGKKGLEEVLNLKWEKAAKKVREVYELVLHRQAV